MKRVVLLAFVAFVSSGVFAQQTPATTAKQDLKKDVQDLKKDEQDRKQALKNKDKAEAKKDAADIKADKKEIRSDMKEMKTAGIKHPNHAVKMHHLMHH